MANNRVEWSKAPDIKKRVLLLKKDLKLDWLSMDRIYCFRSKNSKARAYARIWGLGRIWQMAMDLKPSYVIEVISEKYDKLSEKEKNKVLIHELVHIPKNFSGSLVPHYRKGKRNFQNKVKSLVAQYNKKQK